MDQYLFKMEGKKAMKIIIITLINIQKIHVVAPSTINNKTLGN